MDTVAPYRDGEVRITDRLRAEHAALRSTVAALDGLVRTDASDDAIDAAVRSFWGPLLSHLETEERTLFAALADALGGAEGPLAALAAEHDTLRRTLAVLVGGSLRLERMAATGDLVALLRDHVAEEEARLFPLAARLLGEARLRELGARAERVAVEASYGSEL